MLKMTILDFDSGHPHRFFGSEEDLKRWIRQMYPEVRGLYKLTEMAEKLNEIGDVEIHITEVDDGGNLLPENYWAKDAKEYPEPWVREAHLHDDNESDTESAVTARLGLKDS
jgi:hypothetical protein